MRNIAIITLDTLRWDTCQAAYTPNLNALFRDQNVKWHRVFAQGTYTLPSHVSLFRAGWLPSNELDSAESWEYKNQDFHVLFKLDLKELEGYKARFVVPGYEGNLVRGFDALGYRTVGVGGVGWFDMSTPTARNAWRQFFDEFHFELPFREEFSDSFERQIVLCHKILEDTRQPLFFFLDVAALHRPCRDNDTWQGQCNALEYVDSHIMELINLLPRPVTIILWSDHGTCFGEDGCWGHGFYHPKVMEVPMAIFDLD